MKKRYVIVAVAILMFLVLTLSGCRLFDNLFARGRDGRDGIDGRDGRDGLSTYEIFCKNYIYIDSEKQWIDDLVSGTLERIDNSVLEEKQYWEENSNVDFAGSDVILLVDRYFYQKKFTADDFHMIEVETVELLWDDTDDGQQPGNQEYLLTLKEKSRQAVVNAIYTLEIYAFTKAAYPNMLSYPCV